MTEDSESETEICLTNDCDNEVALFGYCTPCTNARAEKVGEIDFPEKSTVSLTTRSVGLLSWGSEAIFVPWVIGMNIILLFRMVWRRRYE